MRVAAITTIGQHTIFRVVLQYIAGTIVERLVVKHGDKTLVDTDDEFERKAVLSRFGDFRVGLIYHVKERAAVPVVAIAAKKSRIPRPGGFSYARAKHPGSDGLPSQVQ